MKTIRLKVSKERLEAIDQLVAKDPDWKNKYSYMLNALIDKAAKEHGIEIPEAPRPGGYQERKA